MMTTFFYAFILLAIVAMALVVVSMTVVTAERLRLFCKKTAIDVIEIYRRWAQVGIDISRERNRLDVEIETAVYQIEEQRRRLLR